MTSKTSILPAPATGNSAAWRRRRCRQSPNRRPWNWNGTWPGRSIILKRTKSTCAISNLFVNYFATRSMPIWRGLHKTCGHVLLGERKEKKGRRESGMAAGGFGTAWFQLTSADLILFPRTRSYTLIHFPSPTLTFPFPSLPFPCPIGFLSFPSFLLVSTPPQLRPKARAVSFLFFDELYA